MNFNSIGIACCVTGIQLCNGSKSVVPTGQPVEQPDSLLCNRHLVIQRVKLGIHTEHMYRYNTAQLDYISRIDQ